MLHQRLLKNPLSLSLLIIAMDCGKRAVSSSHENTSCLTGLVLLGNSNTILHPAVKVRTRAARWEGAADSELLRLKVFRGWRVFPS